jgi:DNA replication and repair protein RecF
LVQHGTYIAEQRSALISSLVPFAKELQLDVSGKDELLSLNYVRSGNEDLELAYEEKKEAEAKQRLTLVGPHRDDLELSINSLLASKFASEGQQRTIALSLKIAQSHVLRERKGSNPILLIDDIFGELDSSRRNRLLSSFPEGAQKIITTTSLDWALDGCLEGSRCYSLSNGLLDEM